MKQSLFSIRENNSFRNQVNSLFRKSKKYYNHKLFSSVKSYLKIPWNTINEVLKPNPSKNKSALRSLVFKNETYNDELEIVQLYN